MNNLQKEADKWVFETNGNKWSNNDSTAGDNYGSFIAGADYGYELPSLQMRAISIDKAENINKEQFLNSEIEL